MAPSSATVGSLSEINVYPLKSAAGRSLTRAKVVTTGFEDDRQWLIVDPSGRFVTQRGEPRLCLIRAEVSGGGLTLSAPGRQAVSVPAPAAGPSKKVSVWDDVVDALPAGPEAAAWLTSFLGAPYELVRMPQPSARQVDLDYADPGDTVGFADAFPFLLISQGSLDELNRRLTERGEPLMPMNRFRPNLVVAGTEPFAEDGWRRIAIGAVEFRVCKPCARCAITTVDQDSASTGLEPLRTLATFRRRDGLVMFGQNLIHAGEGELHVGDEVTLLE